MNTLTKIFPWAVVGVFALYAAGAVGKSFQPKQTHKEFDLTAFGSIPVLDSAVWMKRPNGSSPTRPIHPVLCPSRASPVATLVSAPASERE